MGKGECGLVSSLRRVGIDNRRFDLKPSHSYRNAVVGSTPLARKAGMKPARPAAEARTIAEPMNVKGSRALNP